MGEIADRLVWCNEMQSIPQINLKLTPMSRSTTTPPEMKTKVGMALTLYLAAVSGFSSTSTLQNTTSEEEIW